MKQLKKLLFVTALFLVFSSCEKETKTDSSIQETTESISNNRSSHKKWERLTWSEVQGDIHFLEITEKLGINLSSQLGIGDATFIETSIISKCSDVTNDYYSFTFPVTPNPSSGDVIKNVVLEKRVQVYKSNIIEYDISSEDLYALMTNTFTSVVNIAVDIYPVNPYTIQLRDCWWVDIIFVIPCTCPKHHTNPDDCTCINQPVVYDESYLECDNSSTGDPNNEGVNIYPSQTTTGATGGGGGPVDTNIDDGSNMGTEFLIPTYKWYIIKLEQLKDDYDLDISIDELEDIVSIECMGGGNPEVGVFEECAIEDIVDNFLINNPTINTHVQSFLTNHPNNPTAEKHIEEIVLKMISDKEFKSLVESSFTWSGVMWTIAKELVGDKAVDILAGVVGAKDLRDAIKALKNNDWIEFTFEVSQLVLNNTPVGKFLKILEAGSEMYKFAKKIEKIWDKIGNLPEEAVTKLWNIAKKSPVKVNGNYLKYLDDIKFPKFGPYFATKNTYNKNFKNKFPEVSLEIKQVHHAVPQEISNRWNLVNQSDMHSLENLRGMPSQEFHQNITNLWNTMLQPYRDAGVTPPMNLIMAKAKQIDDEFGSQFIPPIR